MKNNLSYPQNILDFQRTFATEQACERYLFKARWPKGFTCPVCGDKEYFYLPSRKVFECASNKHQTSLTAGTIMHRTKLPLQYWFWSAYLVTTDTTGMSALQLQRQLGLKRYEPAYNLLHKLRASMVNPEREQIGSTVEVDETYVGGPTTGGKRGRGTQKAIVIVAIERKRNGHAGRIRLRKIPNVSEKSVMGFIQDVVRPGSTVITDGLTSYRNLSSYGYKHRAIPGVHQDEAALPLAHIAISNMKTWLKGTFHGVSKKHLQAYLNEYVFRFNRRFRPMAGFRTVLGLSSKVKRWPTYDELYSGAWKHPNPKNGGK